jgi:hypothetical protein
MALIAVSVISALKEIFFPYTLKPMLAKELKLNSRRDTFLKRKKTVKRVIEKIMNFIETFAEGLAA